MLQAENTVMSENGHGGSAQKRFIGDGNSGAAWNKAWKRWARAALVVKTVGGMPPEGSVALNFHSSGRSGRTCVGVDRNQGHVFGWRRGVSEHSIR